MSTGYPVLNEYTLESVEGGRLRRGRRTPSALPQATPGVAVVLKYRGQYVLLDESLTYSGREDLLVAATAAITVNVRAHAFSVDLVIPSASAADDFSISVVFHAQVRQPVVAAQNGPVDMVGLLRRHLRNDRKLLEIGHSYGVEDIAEVRELVETRIDSYCQVMPVMVPGIAVSFASAEVLTPDEVRNVEAVKRDEAWAEEAVRRKAAREHERNMIKLNQENELTRRGQETEFEKTRQWAGYQTVLDSDADAREHQRGIQQTHYEAELGQLDEQYRHAREELSRKHDFLAQKMGLENDHALEAASADLSHERAIADARNEMERRWLEERNDHKLESQANEETYQRELARLERNHILAATAGQTENEQTERLLGLIERGATSVEALAVLRGQLTPQQLAQAQRDRDENKRTHLLRVLQVLQADGRLDLVDMSMQDLVDAVLTELTGHRIGTDKAPELEPADADHAAVADPAVSGAEPSNGSYVVEVDEEMYEDEEYGDA